MRSTVSFRFAPIALALLTLSVACFQGARAPNVSPRATLSLNSDRSSDSDPGAFAVVFAGPKGEGIDPREISIVFNRPMRALALAGGEAPFPAKISPTVPGRWQWVGTRAATFIPERPDAPGGLRNRLARATEYTVEVPSGTKALDGSVLTEAYRFGFSTPRPRVARSTPPDGTKRLARDTEFELVLNQPIPQTDISKHFTLKANGVPIPSEVNAGFLDDVQRVTIKSRLALPLDSDIAVEVSADLPAVEGPLTAGSKTTLNYRTYGPLRVTEVGCNRNTPNKHCDAQGGVNLEFSNPVRFSELKRLLNIQPALKVQWPGWLTDEDEVDWVSVEGRFQPGASYTVSLKSGAAGLRDVYGQALDRDLREAVRFDDLWPTARLGVYGRIFEPGHRSPVPVASINVTDLELVTAPVTEDQVLTMSVDKYSESPDYSAIAGLAGATKQKLPQGPRNKVANHMVRTETVLGDSNKRGPVAVGIRYTSRPGEDRMTEETAILQVTDLGISAKVSPKGSLVWVTKLSTAAPIKDAEVIIRRPKAADVVARTDANGFATFDAAAYQPTPDTDAVIIVRHDNDWAYRAVARELNGWRFGVPYSGISGERPFGMLFTDRGIYRPGDTVRVKGIVREDAEVGTKTPVGKSVKIEVSSPDGDEVFSGQASLTAFGTFSIDVRVPTTGRIGTHFMQATVGSSPYDSSDLSGSFEVAEYRPAEFEVGVESARPSYIRGDDAKWITRGDYLFGAPMAGSEVATWVTRQPTSFRPPGLEAGVVDDSEYWYDLAEEGHGHYEVASTNAALNKQGLFETQAKLSMPGQIGPERVSAESTVTDLSRQSLSASTTAIVHPGEFYLALDPKSYFVAAGDKLAPEVLAVAPSGKRVTGVAFKINLIRRKWVVAKQATGGGVHHVSKPVDETIGSCSLTSTQGPASCPLTPPGAGYYILRAVGADKRGNPIASSSGIYVTGAGVASWPDSDSLELKLVADKKTYEVGDTARILVKSPFQKARALVTVERAGIRTQSTVDISGPMATIPIQVDETLRPNAYVSVLLIRGRTGNVPQKPGAPDVGAPAFRMGYAEIPVNPEARRLTVALSPNKRALGPGETVNVDMTVRDRSGKPVRSEITLYAVDEGVLSLVGYTTPDPIPVFGAPRNLQVTTIENRMALATTFSPFSGFGLDKGLDGGGGGEDSAALGPNARRDFRSVAYFNPSIVTDDAGRAKASFKLPETLTTFRLMAVAVSQEDQFGYADDRLVVSRSLMARPALPRFLRAGDRLEGGVIVTSKGHAASEITVQAVATGVTITGPTEQTIQLGKDDSQEVRFQIDAPRAGTAKLGFIVSGGGVEDRVEVTREVQTPLSLEAVALYGDTDKQSAERLGDISSIRPDIGGLTVKMASTALVGIDGGAEQLIEYPYGCTEQMISRLVPMVPLRELGKDFGFPLPKNTDQVIEATVAKVMTHQRQDGGFGLWPDSPNASAWVTTYALWGLHQAKASGVVVPDRVMENAVSFLRRELKNRGDTELGRATAPFVVYVLAEIGQPDAGRTTQLFEDRERLPLFGKALLLHAMVLGKADRESVQTLATEIEGSLSLDGPVARATENIGDEYAVLMDSTARTSALVLRALVAARPKHPMASRLAKGLLADRKGGTWRSTQESAWALLALSDYRKAQEDVEPDFDASLFMGEAELLAATFQGRSLSVHESTIPAARLTSAGGSVLSFDVRGQGRLFYEARLQYAPKKLPLDGLDRGFFVQKRYRAVTPETLQVMLASTPERSLTAFDGGDLVLADIVVVSPSPRTYVVIDSPLPAGMEAIDSRLATTSKRMQADRYEDSGDDEQASGEAYQNTWYRREVRDDRVLFFIDHLPAGMYRYRYLARATSLGRFVVPPTKAEEMYAPEVFGRTGAEVVKISP